MLPPSLLWLILAGLLLAMELGGADFEGLLVGAVAALLASILTALVPLPAWIPIALFAAVVVVGTAALRRWSARQGERAIPGAAHEELAEAITAFGPDGEGRVRWHGQSWAAEVLEPCRTIAAGERVVVMGRDGNRLQVLPRSPLTG